VKLGDLETVLTTIELARHILGEYIAPGPRDPTVAISRLMLALDDPDFVKALDHLNRRRVIRLIE
jgi:hypothetical protein